MIRLMGLIQGIRYLTYVFRNFIVTQCHTIVTKVVLLNRCNLWEMLHPIFYPFENSMHRITGLETSQKSGFALVKIPLSKELVYIFQSRQIFLLWSLNSAFFTKVKPEMLMQLFSTFKCFMEPDHLPHTCLKKKLQV